MFIEVLENKFIGCNCSYQESEIVLLGIPFDGTVSFRAGTRNAPSHIRNESIGLETYSLYQDQDLSSVKVFDAGDLDLPFGNTKRTLEIIQKAVSSILKDNKKLFLVGGEHLITYPVIKAVHQKYKDLCVIHFDAHADIRDEYLGEKLSHATVMRRIWDTLGDNRIFQFGIRSGIKEEFLWSEEGHTTLEKFSVNTISSAIKEIGERPVYITVDLDVLDTSVFPGTGTPEPGGLSFMELLSALLSLTGLNIVGVDVLELVPQYDLSGVSTAVACKIIREMLLLIGKSIN